MRKIADTTADWANSDPANTAVTIELEDAPVAAAHPGGLLEVRVYNPSTETALTGMIQKRWDDSEGNERYATVSTPAGQSTFTILDADDSSTDSQAILIDGGLQTSGGRLVLSNNTAVGVAGAFTAQVQVWAL